MQNAKEKLPILFLGIVVKKFNISIEPIFFEFFVLTLLYLMHYNLTKKPHHLQLLDLHNLCLW